MRILTGLICLLALSVRAEPLRIASYSPGATQTLLDLGCGGEIVAATRWCPLPATHAAIRDCDAFAPDLEKLRLAKPSLVILPRMANPLWAEKCRGAGLRVLVLQPEGPDSLLRDIREIGEATGRMGKASELAQAFEPPETGPALKLLLIWDGMMAGPDSYLAPVLHRTGFRSALPRGTWVKLDWETLAAADPDAILWLETRAENSLISRSKKKLGEMAGISSVKELKCVKKSDIYQADSGSDWLPGSGLSNKLPELIHLRSAVGK